MINNISRNIYFSFFRWLCKFRGLLRLKDRSQRNPGVSGTISSGNFPGSGLINFTFRLFSVTFLLLMALAVNEWPYRFIDFFYAVGLPGLLETPYNPPPSFQKSWVLSFRKQPQLKWPPTPCRQRGVTSPELTVTDRISFLNLRSYSKSPRRLFTIRVQ